MDPKEEKRQQFVDRYGELPIETGGRLRGEFFLSDLGLQELEEPVFRGDARE